MGYKRMIFAERMSIFKMLYTEGKCPAEIAKVLGRNESSVTREINKASDGGTYNPFVAESLHIEARRNQCPKLKISDEVWAEIKPQLEKRRSPDEIAKWLSEKEPSYTLCGKTIYNYVQFHMKGELKKLALQDFRQRGKSRRQEEKRGKLKEMTLIDSRPPEINERVVPGHWEGDLIIGKEHKSAILVTVERKSRFVQMDLLLHYDAPAVRKAIETRFKRLSPSLIKTLTFDQGKENAEHKILAGNLQIAVYFCHPHSPREKGTCENTNGLIRDMLFPVDDFRNFTQRDIALIAKKLNDRPRKTLDYKTPKEVLFNLR